MNAPLDKIYQQLPMVHQLRDADNGEVLRGLLQVIQQQAQAVEDNVRQLYQDAFIETCQPWAVPYIGDLVGITRPAVDTLPEEEYSEREAARQRLLFPRGEVARAVDHYRRKGTLSVIENLANLVANWPARAVEYYELVNQLQSIRDPHPELGGLVDVRKMNDVDRIDGPFDTVAHLLDVRSMKPTGLAGRCNPLHVGLHVWRLKPYSLTETIPQCQCAHRDGDKQITVYAFNPLGLTTQLYTNPKKEESPTSIASEIHVPAPIRMLAFRDQEYADQASADYYGEEKSLAVWVPDFTDSHSDGLVPRHNIMPMDLGDFIEHCTCHGEPIKETDEKKKDVILNLNKSENHNKVAVDPVNGLLAIWGKRRSVKVTFHYGFSGDIGGGEYRRKTRYRVPSKDTLRLRVHCSDPSSGTSSCSLDRIVESALESAWTFESSEEGFTIKPTFDPSRLDGTCPVGSGLTIGIDSESLGDAVMTNGEWSVSLSEQAKKKIKDGRKINVEVEIDAPRKRKVNAEFVVREKRTLKRGQDKTTIEISDSSVYDLGRKTISLNRGQLLEIRSSNRRRPLINLPHDRCETGLKVELAPGSELSLDGLVISGSWLEIGHWDGFEQQKAAGCGCEKTAPPAQEKASASVNIRDCTLDPRGGDCCESCGINFNLPGGIIRIENSIVGSLTSLSKQANDASPTRFSISDSIVHAKVGRAISGEKTVDLRAQRVTFFGEVHVRELNLVEDSIFQDRIEVDRRQFGGIRYSCVPPGSETPARYYCQPDLANELARQAKVIAERNNEPFEAAPEIKPKFTSTEFGNAAYGQLAHDCPIQISQGSEDESEMGAFRDLYQPQRAANLRERLKEFTPVSLETEIIYAN